MNKEKVAEKGELSRERKKEGRKEARKKELPWMYPIEALGPLQGAMQSSFRKLTDCSKRETNIIRTCYERGSAQSYENINCSDRSQLWTSESHAKGSEEKNIL